MARSFADDTAGFAQRLRWARTEYQLQIGRETISQEQIADFLRISRARVSQMETTGGLPDRKKWMRLSHLLSVSLDWLFFNRGSPGEGTMSEDDAAAIERFRSLPPDKRRLAADMINALSGGEPTGGGQAHPTRRVRT